MKILHTSDWHIGKLVHSLHMTEDQALLLEQLKTVIEEEEPDLLVIAGDVYDRGVPPIEAVELLDQVISAIIEDLKTPIVMISGNHDSGERLGFGGQLLASKGLYINTSLPVLKVVISDAYGPVNFYLIPFVEPAEAKLFFGDETIKTHDDAMKAIMASVDMDTSQRNVAVAHGFVVGSDNPEVSDSERPLSIGGSEYVSVDYFKDFDYVALGHLHKPQKVKYDHIRYAGSLMKYSFSEARQNKSLTMVTIGPDGYESYKQLSLKPERDMRIIKGQLETLMSEDVYGVQNTQDYLMAVLTDQGALIDPIHVLRQVYPNILKLEREVNGVKVVGSDLLTSKAFEEKSPMELFQLFYEKVTEEALDEEYQSFMEKLIEADLKKVRD